MKAWRNAIRGFQENVLKKGQEVDTQTMKYDFKGQKMRSLTDPAPKITREQIDQFSRLDPPIEPQSREIRLKNAFYMGVYIAWFAGIVLFVMYRLKGDDLDLMEKEAEERIKLREAMKQIQKENKKGGSKLV